jgi:formylglycine-generating enzyme required for sulfatase activity
MATFRRCHFAALILTAVLGMYFLVSCSSDSKGTGETAGLTEMILIPAGEFQMGADSPADNSPVHSVLVDSFYIDKHEVTNAQYQAFCEANKKDLPWFWGIERYRCGPDYPDHPVLGVTWGNAKAYAEWCGKRLPTEAEWEYAARGGLDSLMHPWGTDLDSTRANYWSSEGTKPVGSYAPNGYGLYNMVGNIAEWVADYFDEDYYRVSPRENPTGPEKGKFRVIRGGGWHSGPGCVRVYRRQALAPYWIDFNTGFRCARDVR